MDILCPDNYLLIQNCKYVIRITYSELIFDQSISCREYKLYAEEERKCFRVR